VPELESPPHSSWSLSTVAKRRGYTAPGLVVSHWLALPSMSSSQRSSSVGVGGVHDHHVLVHVVRRLWRPRSCPIEPASHPRSGHHTQRRCLCCGPAGDLIPGPPARSVLRWFWGRSADRRRIPPGTTGPRPPARGVALASAVEYDTRGRGRRLPSEGDRMLWVRRTMPHYAGCCRCRPGFVELVRRPSAESALSRVLGGERTCGSPGRAILERVLSLARRPASSIHRFGPPLPGTYGPSPELGGSYDHRRNHLRRLGYSGRDRELVLGALDVSAAAGDRSGRRVGVSDPRARPPRPTTLDAVADGVPPTFPANQFRSTVFRHRGSRIAPEMPTSGNVLGGGLLLSGLLVWRRGALRRVATTRSVSSSGARAVVLGGRAGSPGDA